MSAAITTATALATGALAVAAALLVRRGLRRRRHRLRWPATVATVLAVVLAGTWTWAHLMIDRSTAARAIAWMDADTGDWRRFPARPVPAGPAPLALRDAPLPEGALDAVRLPRGATSLSGLLEDTGTTAFLVLHGDDVVVEQYLNGSSREATQTSFSVAKSFASTLVGIAIARGEIASLDEPVTTYVPELLARDERFADITLRDLVTMSSGLRYVEHSTPWSDDAVTYYSPDLRAAAIGAEVVEAPGERWHYNNYNPLLIGLVLERATGRPVADYLAEELWQPMGAEADGSWSLDSEASGFEKMESGINGRARDFAALGYLFAHDGAVGGRQVVPADWVREATAKDVTTDPAAHYQYFWWVDTERPGRFYAMGNHGQFIYVDPATDVVVVRMGDRYGLSHEEWPALLRDVADVVGAGA
ncbi:serine hydrolase domain-containing protein [Georgenia thermotolerans]|uniref:Serine hydrolase n=1 Tax=Georgenia thermotolerans TaxID=527326 RepID=A0A7J5UTD1_9MICO|nr:serine hydrolase [Georgenia thermotolerans]KAE8765542.1 serine hydrolase [Georgenia thermotolerans]